MGPITAQKFAEIEQENNILLKLCISKSKEIKKLKTSLLQSNGKVGK